MTLAALDAGSSPGMTTNAVSHLPENSVQEASVTVRRLRGAEVLVVGVSRADASGPAIGSGYDPRRSLSRR